MATKIAIALCFLFFGCFSRTQVASREQFDAVSTCSTKQEMEAKMGSPYAVHHKGPGIDEYEYIEKIDMGSPQLVKENHYFFTVSEGYVIGKRMSHESPPAYDLIYQDDPNELD